MAKRIDLDEKQLDRWAELLNLLADIARAIIAEDSASVVSACDSLKRAGWMVSIRKGGPL